MAKTRSKAKQLGYSATENRIPTAKPKIKIIDAKVCERLRTKCLSNDADAMKGCELWLKYCLSG